MSLTSTKVTRAVSARAGADEQDGGQAGDGGDEETANGGHGRRFAKVERACLACRHDRPAIAVWRPCEGFSRMNEAIAIRRDAVPAEPAASADRRSRRAAPAARPCRQDRRAAGQSRHAGRDRCRWRAPLSQGIPDRSAGDRGPGPALEDRAQRHHPARAAAPQGARLPQDLERRAERIAAQDHHARAGRKARRARSSRSGAHIVVDWAMRYGNPSIASRLEALRAARLRAHPGGAALSAILRGHHRDRRATRSSAC